MIEKSNQSVSVFGTNLIPRYSIVKNNGQLEWAFIPDVEEMKRIFESRFPNKVFTWVHHPHYNYYYKIMVENRKINESIPIH